jgi:hypothetical protein
MRAFDADETDVATFQSVSGLAVAGLVIGLLAPSAMLDPMFWVVPLVGIAVGAWALWQIRRRAGALVGRKAALAGLLLSVVFAAAAPTDWTVYRWRLRSEARQVADLWFECLRRQEPHKAYQLLLDPMSRRPLDERLWAVYRETPRWRDALVKYVAQPLPRTLLALGPKATVRYCECPDQGEADDKPWVQLLYAVTYDEGAGPTTFFVSVSLERTRTLDGRANWHISQALGGVRPEGW